MKIVVVRKTRVAVSKAAGVGSSPAVPANIKKNRGTTWKEETLK